MFSTLVVYAIYTFTHKGFPRAWSQVVMLATALLMYFISLSHWCLQSRILTANYTAPYLGAAPGSIELGVVPPCPSLSKCRFQRRYSTLARMHILAA